MHNSLSGGLTSEAKHIAILDDDRTFRLIVSALLSRQANMTVSEIETSADLYDLFAERNIDCLLLDYNLGDENGFAVRQRLAEKFGRLPPVVILSGDERQSIAIKALRVGVDDFLPKRGLSTAALLSSIAAAEMKHAAAFLLKSEVRRLSEASEKDHITGLATRLAIEEHSTRLRASGSKFSTLVIEVEQITFFETTFGSLVANKAAKKFAEQVQNSLRSTDSCSLWKQGVFVAIIEPLPLEPNIDSVCTRMQKALSFRLDLPEVSAVMMPQVRTIEDIDDLRSSNVKVDEAQCLPSEKSLNEVKRQSIDYPNRTEDRRRELRRRVFKKGQIIIAEATAIIDCNVRNISEHGAGIRLDTAAAPPIFFELKIAGADRSRSVTIRWQNGCDIGVEYLD